MCGQWNAPEEYLCDGEIVSDNTYLGGTYLGAGRGLAGRRGESASAAERRAEQRSEFQQRLQELNSPCYETRRLSAQRLERWLDMPEMAAMLAEQFQQLIVQPELPYEVRWRISIWRTRLPPVKSEPPQSVAAEELARLVCQLDDDSYAVRAGASECLQWMAASGTWPNQSCCC